MRFFKKQQPRSDFEAAAHVLVSKTHSSQIADIIPKLEAQMEENPAAALAVAEAIAAHHVDYGRIVLAKSPVLALSPDTILKLSKDKVGEVRAQLASNPALGHSEKAIKNLLKEESPWIRVRLAQNPSVLQHQWALAALREDPDNRVREVLPEQKTGNSAAAALKALGLDKF